MMSRLHARLRSFRALTAVVAATILLSAAPPAYAEERESPRAAPSPSPSASSSLAGNQAGQGRPRPGRTTVSAEASAPGGFDPSLDALVPDLPELPTLPSVSGRPPSGSASPSAGRSASSSAEPGNGKSSGGKGDREPDGEPEREGGDEDGEDDEDVLSEDFGFSTDVPFPLRTPPLDATGRERNDQAASQPVARAVPALTLGIGMALMGLGIGFLGVRLRRH
ncbi:hypothetical protein [Streptomyces sp. NP-1717]|uniref:hypothetical protein n=1 Tax=Streptomyces sp. NP-1717 TaxID=2704470 RepID=UPI001F5C5F07|nr:hypothetical protein [Streptomyces sp. NP-1717]MCI3223613.1 hypothetical protein [Streptomyces sp. NP-1717]